jgi:hypothetical protein
MAVTAFSPRPTVMACALRVAAGRKWRSKAADRRIPSSAITLSRMNLEAGSAARLTAQISHFERNHRIWFVRNLYAII